MVQFPGLIGHKGPKNRIHGHGFGFTAPKLVCSRAARFFKVGRRCFLKRHGAGSLVHENVDFGEPSEIP
jgi:hypothetical protein